MCGCCFCPPGPRGGFSTVSGKKCFRLTRGVVSLGVSMPLRVLFPPPSLGVGFRFELDAIRRLAPLIAICVARPAPVISPRLAKAAAVVLFVAMAGLVPVVVVVAFVTPIAVPSELLASHVAPSSGMIVDRCSFTKQMATSAIAGLSTSSGPRRRNAT